MPTKVEIKSHQNHKNQRKKRLLYNISEQQPGQIFRLALFIRKKLYF